MSAGLAGQLGFKSETVWGTAVTVDQFHAGFLSGNPVREQPPLISKGIRAGRRLPACISTGAKTVEGPLALELYVAPLATLLRHMFGTIAVAGTGPYTHTASPGPLNAKSFTTQVGIPDVGGTVRAFTYSGCKIPEWSIKGKVGEIATLDLKVSAKDYVTATALASASYGSTCPFTFVHGSVTVGGNAQATVDDFELSCKRPLRVKHPVGSTLIMEQKEEGQVEFGIKFNADFEDLTLHDLGNTAVAVVLAFSDGTNSLTVTSNAWVEPTTPEIAGADEITPYEFTAIPYHATSDASAITAVLVNSEATNT